MFWRVDRAPARYTVHNWLFGVNSTDIYSEHLKI